jgi:heterodisulfide reductase subunit A
VGTAHGPMGSSESMIQAQAASGKILSRLIPGEKVIPEVKVSQILEDFCTGCQTCLEVCCYGAITFDEIKGVSVVNAAICRGCGNCAASCPSGAIRAKHFTASQLYMEMIEAIR